MIVAPGQHALVLLYRPGQPGNLRRMAGNAWEFWTGHLSLWHYVAYVVAFGYVRHLLMKRQAARELAARRGRPGMLDQRRRS